WSFDIDPVHTSVPPLLGTTSYGLPHGVGSLYSAIRSVSGSNMPMALPPYWANHSRPWSSNRPRRGRVRGAAVDQILTSPLVPLRMPTLLPPNSRIRRLCPGWVGLRKPLTPRALLARPRFSHWPVLRSSR